MAKVLTMLTVVMVLPYCLYRQMLLPISVGPYKFKVTRILQTPNMMDQPMGDLRSQLIPDQQSDGAVFKTVLFYSVLILLLPIASFFATKSVLFEWFLGQVTF